MALVKFGGMKNALAEKLKEVKIDYSAYGTLPIREDAYLIQPASEEDKKNKTLFKQWEKLNYIRKNLKILDRYIKTSGSEKLTDWLKKNNVGMSTVVLEKIGSHTNETGGISAYFFNLQKFYDEQEIIYDIKEALAHVPADFSGAIDAMRKEREEKRNGRGKTRKLFIRDMKLDGKGYLNIPEEMPTREELSAGKGLSAVKDLASTDGLILSADGSQAAEEVKKTTAPLENKNGADKAKIGEELKKKNKKIGIYVAGTVIFIATALALASSVSETKNG